MTLPVTRLELHVHPRDIESAAHLFRGLHKMTVVPLSLIPDGRVSRKVARLTTYRARFDWWPWPECTSIAVPLSGDVSVNMDREDD